MQPNHYSIPITASLLLALPFTTLQATVYDTQTFLGRPDADNYVDEPRGFDTDADDIYLVDTINNKVEKVTASGELEFVAGSGEYGLNNGAAATAHFAEPKDIAVFGENGEQLFIADTNNHVIRKIENGQVTTFLTGLASPQGVAIDGDTLFVSDTGNNRILGINRAGGATTEFAKNLNQPTKLLYWPSARSILFVNAGEGTVRSVNVTTGVVSDPLIANLEDIGGIFLQQRNLYVVSSYSIGVFNEIWKVRLSKPDPAATPSAISTTLLSKVRETEQLNWPSDVLLRQETLNWEEYYSWDPSLLYEPAAVEADAGPTCGLKSRKAGQTAWRTKWFVALNNTDTTYSERFMLPAKYQGDQIFFRIKNQYDNKKLSDRKRTRQHTRNQSGYEQSRIFGLPVLSTNHRLSRSVRVHWGGMSTAETFNLQLWHSGERVKTFRDLTETHKRIGKKYLMPNQPYQFRVQPCTNGNCRDWTDFKTFRTVPAKPKRIAKVVPMKGLRMEPLANGKFMTTVQFKLRKASKHLRAVVEVCAKDPQHADTITFNRMYVLYKGGSSLLAWHTDGTTPERIVGEHRFEDRMGSTAEALVGRPKDLVFSSDGTKLYLSENNKLAVYDFATQQLSELAGHAMDSYREGVGDEARFSDPTAIALSPDDDWLYVVDRNNHRIRKVDTATGATSYITGAGGNNFSFVTQDSNGYAEGGSCANETDLAVAGCAYFNRPTGITVSPDGTTLYVAEGSNNRIRSVRIATGVTSLIAGNGTAGYVNSVGSSAQFNGPYTLDISSDGKTLYVADKYNGALRAINLSTKAVTTIASQLSIPEYVKEENGTLYWTEAGSHKVRAMSLTSRVVMTLSGNGNVGYVNGAGSSAQWHNPKGFDFRSDKMYVADTTNDVIRTITF